VPHHFGTRPFAGTVTSVLRQLHVTVAGRTTRPRTPDVTLLPAVVSAVTVGPSDFVRRLAPGAARRSVTELPWPTYRANDYLTCHTPFALWRVSSVVTAGSSVTLGVQERRRRRRAGGRFKIFVPGRASRSGTDGAPPDPDPDRSPARHRCRAPDAEHRWRPEDRSRNGAAKPAGNAAGNGAAPPPNSPLPG